MQFNGVPVTLFDQVIIVIVCLLIIAMVCAGLYRLLVAGIAYEKQVEDTTLRAQRLPPNYDVESGDGLNNWIEDDSND